MMLTKLSFFFSSRRRHTSSDRDWSSDVCSSDLAEDRWPALGQAGLRLLLEVPDGPVWVAGDPTRLAQVQIGRASCRERVVLSVGGGSSSNMSRRITAARSLPFCIATTKFTSSGF